MNYYFQQFLESSSIHGLVYVSTERKLSRFFWFLVIITGFTIATILINDAFTNWSESPIKTTIETRPISEITFPKVTVCPPKNTSTDLNYDLMMLENKTFTNETRKEFLDIAKLVFLETYFEIFLSNFTALEEENKFYNWFHGYSEVSFQSSGARGLQYFISTSATTGSLRTQYFGDKFDPHKKIVRKLFYALRIYPPAYAVNNPEYTLNIKIDKLLLNVTGDSVDTMFCTTCDAKAEDISFTAPGEEIYIEANRDVTWKDILSNSHLKSMPGFDIKWSFNKKLNPDPKFDTSIGNQMFKR